jgi:hypothetical protein
MLAHLINASFHSAAPRKKADPSFDNRGRSQPDNRGEQADPEYGQRGGEQQYVALKASGCAEADGRQRKQRHRHGRTKPVPEGQVTDDPDEDEPGSSNGRNYHSPVWYSPVGSADATHGDERTAGPGGAAASCSQTLGAGSATGGGAVLPRHSVGVDP